MDLLNIGVELEEEDQSLLLLCLLSESFDPLVMTLLYGKETLVNKEIVSVLQMNKQGERMVRSSMEVPQDAMMVGERPRREKDRHKVMGR